VHNELVETEREYVGLINASVVVMCHQILHIYFTLIFLH